MYWPSAIQAAAKPSWLCAIGHQLIEQGRRVLFIGCRQLVQDLLIATKGILR